MDDEDNVIVGAMVEYLENALEQERVLRDLLDKVGYNDPEHSVEDCFGRLVIAYLRLVCAYGEGEGTTTPAQDSP
jgi:hypothetical protein